MGSAPRSIVLDTDIGTNVDDALALALVLGSPELDLRLVTTVSHDTVLRAQIAKKLLRLAGREAIPVAAGAPTPILHQDSFRWWGLEGDGIVVEGEVLPLAAEDATALLAWTIERHQPHVVAIGPLTNLALSFMRDPSLPALVPGITVMGGFLGREARPPVPPTEYNLASDPAATVSVLDAGISTTLVPLDVTLQVSIGTTHLARLRRVKSLLVQTLCDAIEIYARVQGLAGERLVVLHDPLAVAALIAPELFTWTDLRLRPTITAGQLLLGEDSRAPAWRVAVGVDVAAAREWILTRLERLP